MVLSKLEGDSDSDSTFINASYIDVRPSSDRRPSLGTLQGGMRPNEYIAAAMPHNDITRCDFWRMVLEQKTRMIVMLNDETEQNSQAYWPKEINQPTTCVVSRPRP